MDYRKFQEDIYKDSPPILCHRHPNPFIRYVQNKRTGISAKLAEKTGALKILEVGCGDGFLLHELERKKLGTIIGLDIVRKAISDASERTVRSILLNGDAINIPLKSNSFDLVVCVHVLEHMLTPQSIVSEIHRVLREEGKLVVGIPDEKKVLRLKEAANSFGLGKLFLGRLSPKRTPGHLIDFDLNVLEEYLKGLFVFNEVLAVPSRFYATDYVCLCTKI